MKIITLNKWTEDNYVYDLINDLKVLKDVEQLTFDSNTREKVENIRVRLMNKDRRNSDKMEVKKYYYINYYLSNFLQYSPDNFDRLLRVVNDERVILVENLKSMNND